MTEYSENGLTLRWEEPDLASGGPPGPFARVVVAVRPAHPANVVRAVYTVDGGAPRTALGFRLSAPLRSDGEERFAVDLPRPPGGALLAFVPALSRLGREADPRRGGFPFSPLVPPPSAAPPATEAAAQPASRPFDFTMELLGRVSARLENPPVAVGETIDGLHIVFPLASGGTVTGPRLNGRIEHAGGDWMLVRRDGIGISEIRVLIETLDGAVAVGSYGGVVDFGEDGYARLAAGRGPERASVQLAPRYVTSSPKLLWLNRLQCIGLGRVTLATKIVEYDLYATRSLGANAP